MIKELLNRVVAVAVAAAAAFVAVVALGAAVYYLLLLVLLPLGAAAVTATLFALVSIITFTVFAKKAAGDDDDHDDEEPESVPARVLQLVQQRPIIGIVAALAAGALIVRKPGLAALAFTAFSETRDNNTRGSKQKSRSRSRR